MRKINVLSQLNALINKIEYLNDFYELPNFKMQSLPKITGNCSSLLCLKAKVKGLEFLFMHLTSPKKGYVFAVLHHYSL